MVLLASSVLLSSNPLSVCSCDFAWTGAGQLDGEQLQSVPEEGGGFVDLSRPVHPSPAGIDIHQLDEIAAGPPGVVDCVNDDVDDGSNVFGVQAGNTGDELGCNDLGPKGPILS
ncbi:hypothetical protein [Dietzia sp. Alg238-R159]|uniref:hypothetical protein n=1 Tax=Dietzia sp. Alg238-R159 TaxID=2305986 RepID=UPI0013D4785D|nr:hypothetical protein [Dietzia sp. Alg238-R159]